MKGPKRQSATMKRLRGVPASRAGKPAPTFTASRTAEPPAWLSDGARNLWNKIAPQLIEKGLLAVVDEPALGVYVDACDRFAKASEILSREGLTVPDGRGGVKKHPATSIAAAAAHTVRQYAMEFGFTPASRANVEAVTGPQSDPLAEFLNSNRDPVLARVGGNVANS